MTATQLTAKKAADREERRGIITESDLYKSGRNFSANQAGELLKISRDLAVNVLSSMAKEGLLVKRNVGGSVVYSTTPLMKTGRKGQKSEHREAIMELFKIKPILTVKTVAAVLGKSDSCAALILQNMVRDLILSQRRANNRVEYKVKGSLMSEPFCQSDNGIRLGSYFPCVQIPILKGVAHADA